MEYFLFDNHLGYCQHYASAATLLYRMYGIPARYVTGYKANRRVFTETENGEWIASVTGTEAHAWTEIFMEGYGWIPVEVTPNAGGSFNVQYPGFDQEELRRIQKEKGWITEGEDAEIPPVKEHQKTELRKKRLEMGLQRKPVRRADQIIRPLPLPLRILAVLAVLALVAVLFILLFRNLSLYRRRKWYRLPLSGRYLWLMEMLHFAGAATDYTGDEKEFPGELSRDLGEITEGDAARVRNMVFAQVYGNEAPSEEESKYFRLFCRKCAQLLEPRTEGVRRLLFLLRYKSVF